MASQSKPLVATNRQALAVGLLLAAAILAATDASASVLCSSRFGHLRLRERCPRHEIQIDVRELGRPGDDLVPLTDWTPASRSSAPAGVESVAAASDSTMLNLTPCRLVDTRPGSTSAFVGDDVGAFADFEIRTYTLTGLCDVPAGASALSINLAVVPGAVSGFASVGPTGSIAAFPPGPNFASINFVGAGPAISNSLMVPLDDMGRIDVYAAREADVIIDTNGYFQPKDAGTNTFFVPGTGTDQENGAALAAVVAEANALPVGVRAAIEIGPGVFDLDTTKISLTGPTALFGASPELTTITCDCTTDALELGGGSDGSSVESLRIENTNAGGNANGVRVEGSDDSALRRVEVTTAGGTGVYVYSSHDLVIENATLDTASNGVFYAITSPYSGSIRNSHFASGVHALSVFGTNSVTVENSTLETTSALAHAVVNTETGGNIDIRHSRLTSGGSSYAAGSGGTFSMTHSFVDAAAIAHTGAAACTATTGPGVFSPAACP